MNSTLNSFLLVQLISYSLKLLRNLNLFARPKEFEAALNLKTSDAMIPDDMLPPSDSDSDDEHLGDRVVNSNRPPVVEQEDTSSDED